MPCSLQFRVRAVSSVGQSRGLIILWSLVRAQHGLPQKFCTAPNAAFLAMQASTRQDLTGSGADAAFRPVERPGVKGAGRVHDEAVTSGCDAEGVRILRYVVRIDQGGSPNPYHGWCSLAVCKPQIRRSAQVGDSIIGLRSRANDQVVCAMRVDEVLPLGDYWRDSRFRAKRPGHRGPPDNFYRADRSGSLVRVANTLHGAELATGDISGRNALVSWHFWYFGDRSPELPTDLVHLVHSGQGHSVRANRRRDDVPTLLAWLAHWPPGIRGAPIDSLRSGQANPNAAAQRWLNSRPAGLA